jgi:CheY-like chemotaxis protein
MTARIRVLVIDNEATILVSAGRVAEGIKRIAAETPNIVLLDLALPDGDGKDVIKCVREWSDSDRNPVNARAGGRKDRISRSRRRRLQRRRTPGAHAHGLAPPMQRKAANPVLRVATSKEMPCVTVQSAPAPSSS